MTRRIPILAAVLICLASRTAPSAADTTPATAPAATTRPAPTAQAGTVMVGGLVKRSGVYTIPPSGITMIGALRAAEISSDSPDLIITFVHRTDPSHLTIKQIAVIDLSDDTDIHLQPHDMLFVQKPKPPATQPAANAPPHYNILGDVTKAATYPLPAGKFTLTQALAGAAVNFNDSQKLIVTLARQIDDKTVQETTEDLSAISSGAALDPPLQPNDTIYVDTRHKSSPPATKPG